MSRQLAYATKLLVLSAVFPSPFVNLDLSLSVSFYKTILALPLAEEL